MALQVWLPLAGKIDNQGLNGDITVTNNGATIVNNGKLGKCYSFNGSSSYLAFNSPVNISNNFSICCWLDLTNINSTQYFIQFGNNGGIRYSTSDNSFLYFSNSQTLTWSYTKVSRFVHVAFVCNSNSVKLYVDGVQIGNGKSLTSGANTCVGIGKRADGYYYNGKMNDFRIYDNALTADDVKRIYQTRVWDIVPYTHMGRGLLFDRSGFMLMPLINTGTTWHGNALYFDGSSIMRPKAGNVGFNLTGGTMSVWFTPKATSNSYNIIYVDSTSKFGIGLLNSNTSMIVCCGSQALTAVVSKTFTAGQLYNVIVTYDSNYTAIKCYIDGVAVTVSGNNYWSESNGLTLGGRTYNSESSRFNGKVHKVSIMSSQLSAQECINLYNSERGLFLPDEYMQLEYIQTTGTQWIDTGIKGNMGYTYEIEFQQTDTSNYRIWGAFNQSSYVGQNMSFTYATGWALRWENTTTGQRLINNIATINTNKHSAIIKNGHLYFDGVDKGITEGHNSSFVFNYNLFLGTINPGGTTPSANSKAKYYKYSVYNNDGAIIQGLIPAKRKNDNVVGMYDTITGNFLTNAGTGTFTAGPEW